MFRSISPPLLILQEGFRSMKVKINWPFVGENFMTSCWLILLYCPLCVCKPLSGQTKLFLFQALAAKLNLLFFFLLLFTEELRKLSWSGIPRQVRPITWKLLSVSRAHFFTKNKIYSLWDDCEIAFHSIVFIVTEKQSHTLNRFLQT